MFRNYLKFIFRKLIRSKIYVFFSITSLSIGLALSILIYLYIANELNYDTFFNHSRRIVRLEFVSTFRKGESYKYAILPGVNLPSQLQSIPEVEKNTRLVKLPLIFVKTENNNKIAENSGFCANSSFFDIFNFKIIAGDDRAPLSKPSSIVLTQKTARRYFGRINPVGKSLTIYFGKHKVTLMVTAVIENIRRNSHFAFNFIATESAYESLFNYHFSQAYVAYEYLLLSKNVNIETIAHKLDQLIPKNGQKDFHYELMPITKIHLHSNARYEIKPNGSIRTVYFFSLIAVVILIISAINFISLFLSHSAGQSKVFGVRKVLGADNGQLATQLLLESTGIALLSLPLAFVMSWVCMPLFNSLTGEIFTIYDLLSMGLIWKALIFAGFTGLLSGIYPALILPKNADVKGVKGSTLRRTHSTKSVGSSFFQHTIVIIQFSASVLLIVGTLVVCHQLTFMQDKYLGFHKKGIITTSNYFNYLGLGKKLVTFKEMLSNNANIKNISVSSYIPGTSETGGTDLVESLESGKKITCEWVSVDYNFFKTYGIEIISGRFFSKDFPTDSAKAFMINEAAVKALGLKNPLGTQLRTFNRTGKIIGIVKDFNYLSLHKKIPPMVFLMDPKVYFSLSIKLATNKNISNTIGDIKKAWYALLPNIPFKYDFLQDQFNKLYKSDRKAGQSYLAFSIIAILVSCLGLFSLASYSMQKRTKEIGIRKVLGATVPNILNLFYGKYLKLIVAANVLTIPVAWLLLSHWLTNFAYRVRIGVVPFLAAFMITGLFTVIAVSYWALKAAWSNPVDSIRRE